MTEEIDRYRRAQARAWLGHVRSMVTEAARLEALVEAERAAYDGLRGIDYTVERVAGTPAERDLAEVMDRLFARIREYTASLAACTDERARAARAIGRMPDARERRVLTERYLLGRDWDEAAKAMDYSVQHIKAIARDAVLHAYEVMPPGWRDPRPPAV